MGIVSERAPRGGASAAADQFLGSLGGGSGGSRRQEPETRRHERDSGSSYRDSSGSRPDVTEVSRSIYDPCHRLHALECRVHGVTDVALLVLVKHATVVDSAKVEVRSERTGLA